MRKPKESYLPKLAQFRWQKQDLNLVPCSSKVYTLSQYSKTHVSPKNFKDQRAHWVISSIQGSGGF